MATDFKYASQSDLNRYVGDIVADADSKRQIYGWGSNEKSNVFDSEQDIAYCYNTGFVSQLFVEGIEINKIEFNTTETTKLNGAVSKGASTLTMDADHGLAAKDIIKINNEYMKVNAVSTNDIGVVPANDRGLFDTASVAHADDSSVFKIMSEGDAGDSTSAGKDALAFVYDEDLDMVLLVHRDLTVNDIVVEAGFDNKTYYDQMLVDASMELNNLLDARYPTPLPKYDQYDANTRHSVATAEYDAIIIKMTCYLAASNALRAIGETEKADYYYDLVTNAEKTGMADRLNLGEFKLAFEVDSHDDKGKVRSVAKIGSMDIVETAGEWHGEKYDVVRITCTTGGAYGTAVVKAETYGNDALFGTTTENIKVTGGLQEIVNGLYVRFQGASMNFDTTPDQWEVTVTGSDRKLTNAQTGAIDLTRRGYSV